MRVFILIYKLILLILLISIKSNEIVLNLQEAINDVDKCVINRMRD